MGTENSRLELKNFTELLKLSSSELVKNSSYEFKDMKVTIDKMNEAHLISDANIDLVGLLMTNDNSEFKVNKALGVCEWHGDISKAEKKEFFTFYERNKPIRFEKSGNKDASKYNNLDEIEPYKSLVPVNKHLKLYIEFSYGNNEKASEIYNKIHLYTIQLIKRIIEELDFEIAEQIIYFVRLAYKNENVDKAIDDVIKDVTSYRPELKKDLTKNSIIIIGKDYVGYSNVVIPNTSTEFSYDEDIMLEIKKDDREYFVDIQIEHSEGNGSHKSNLVEFISRNIVPYIDSADEIRKCFSKLTKYIPKKYDNTTKFIYTKKGDSDLNKRIIYRSFGEFASDLF